MKLLFKQRFFSWFDSYDIYDEAGNVLFVVKGELSWGHQLRVYDANGIELGLLKERVLTFLPKFEVYIQGRYAGMIYKDFSFLKPAFHIDYNGWYIEGGFLECDYRIYCENRLIATATKEFLNLTDTYVIEVVHPQDALSALMLVLAIDAEKCSRK